MLPLVLAYRFIIGNTQSKPQLEGCSIGRQEQAAGAEAAGAYDRKLIAELTRRSTQPGSHKNRCSDANETETFNRV